MCSIRRGAFGVLCGAGLLAAIAMAAIEPAAGGVPAALPRAELEVPRGVETPLRVGEPGDLIRVKLLLAKQPVIAAARERRFQDLLASRLGAAARKAARASPGKITRLEKRAARRAEGRYQRAVSTLTDEAQATRRQQGAIRGAIRHAGGRVLASELVPSALVARLPRRALQRLARRAAVQAIRAAPRPRPLLDVATPLVGAPAWWAAGHTGGEGASDSVPTDVGMIGDAADPAHPAFASVTIDNSPAEPASDHGTHVGGVIASSDATYKGAAPGIDALIGAPGPAYALGITELGVPGASDPAETLNSSQGAMATSDDHNGGEDVIADLFGVGWAAGAGNGNIDGSPTVANIGHNQLVAAAYNDLGTTATSDDVILGISSRGPSPGARKKPDLITPGASIVSPSGDWANTAPPCSGGFTDPDGSCADFHAITGTSLSSPFVAAAMALLEGAAISDPMAQRAILVNSARDWPGQTHWQPDVGWGALDLTEALAQRANFALGSVAEGGARFYRATASAGDKATLAWNRRGVWGALPVCCATAYTTTNLDLRQYRGADLSEVAPPADPGHGGGPDALDPNDTTEQLRAPAEGDQDLIYKVNAASTVEAAAQEDFAIAAQTPLEELDAPGVAVTGAGLDVTGTVNCQPGSGDVVLSAQGDNDSADLEAQDAELELQLPAGVQLISGAQPQQLSGGTLETQATSEPHQWTVRATSSGEKQLSIAGSGQTMGETFVDTEQLSFTADCSAAEVMPSAIGLAPAGTVECGTAVTITTRLVNESHTDADQAQVSIALPSGVELVSGPAVQQVSAGTLALGASSEQHSWSVRQSARGSAAATITGAGKSGGAAVSYPREVMIGCFLAPAATEIDAERPKLRGGRVVAKGTVGELVASRAHAAGAGLVPAGEVRLTWRRGGKTTKRRSDQLDPRGRFKARVKVCRSGRWKVTASYRGSEYHAATMSRLGSVRVNKRDLRC